MVRSILKRCAARTAWGIPAGITMASPGLQDRRLAADADLGLTLQDVHQGVKRRGMLAELLAGVEGEQRHVASVGLRDLAADDRTLLIGSQLKQLQDLAPWVYSSWLIPSQFADYLTSMV